MNEIRMEIMKWPKSVWVWPALVALLLSVVPAMAQNYTVVDTGQDVCYSDTGYAITPPASGEAFYGQDAQNSGYQPSYTTSEDGLTVHDNNTGLTWQQTADIDNDGDIDIDDKFTWDDAMTYAATLNAANFGGYDDWRLPRIKELYSLILFSGEDVSGWTGTDPSELTPFIDTGYFEFGYGDTAALERIIDAQYWSSTAYVSTTMRGDSTAFGVNFADGRIKGYPAEPVGPPGDQHNMVSYVKFVRGNPDYGINEFVDSGSGTITDLATGLVWQQVDDGAGINWEAALGYCEGLVLGACDDWRLPDAKELHSIVDYTRSPDTTGSAAIDPIFYSSPIVNEGGFDDFPTYWSSSTHANYSSTPGKWAAYFAFGEGLGWMQGPFGGAYELMDVHGAGCQRSDPKSGDPGDYPNGHGPQGDVVRINNYVRCVRGDLVPACELRIAGTGSTTIGVYPSCPAPSFVVASGLLSELRADQGFGRAGCIGSFVGEATDIRPEHATGDGYYYLSKTTNGVCDSRGYGTSRGVTPDLRDELLALDPCP